jgi:hypothetical protein
MKTFRFIIFIPLSVIISTLIAYLFKILYSTILNAVIPNFSFLITSTLVNITAALTIIYIGYFIIPEKKIYYLKIYSNILIILSLCYMIISIFLISYRILNATYIDIIIPSLAYFTTIKVGYLNIRADLEEDLM